MPLGVKNMQKLMSLVFYNFQKIYEFRQIEVGPTDWFSIDQLESHLQPNNGV